MSIVNSTATVPFGKYKGIDLQEMVEIDPRYARWMLKETELRRAYPDAYYDLEFYLQGAPRAHRSMSMRY